MTKALLAIETATDLASVALMVGDELIFEEQEQRASHAQVILEMIASLCKRLDFDLRELSGLVLGCGPGSFTGLRIASSVVQALACAYNLPIYRVNSLHAITQQVFTNYIVPEDSLVLSLIDARMQQLYWSVALTKEELSLPLVDFAKDITVNLDKNIILAGVNYEDYEKYLPLELQERVISKYAIYPHAHSLLSIVLEGKIPAEHASKAMPIYIRNNIVKG